MNPGFSERTFEFCFNAEFCQSFGGLLASHPHIPSQQIEKDLGYDVEFRIQQGQFTTSVFLQHKVPCFAEVRAGSNAKFYDVQNGPYFRFVVDNEQHNTLCDLSQTKGNAYYCAPKFHLSHQLETHWRAATIGQTSVLLDPLNVGRITDTERHNVTYTPLGLNPTLHSEARRFSKAYSGDREGAPPFKKRRVSLDYIDELREALVDRTAHSKFRRALTPEVRARRPVEQVQLLLGHVYDVTWILLPGDYGA